MVGMTFLGAVVVTRRNHHLRMDVLVQFMPLPVRVALRIAEQLLLAGAGLFGLTQSYFYARQMFRIGTHQRHGRRSDVGFRTAPWRSASG